MAAPMMSFLSRRMIIGSTSFAVILIGAFYFYYTSRRKPGKDESSKRLRITDQYSAISDEPEKGKEMFEAGTTTSLHQSDSTTVNLIKLLNSDNESILCRVLTTIANKAAFTEGQNTVRCAGGLPVIMRQLQRDSDLVKTSAASCIANLSLNNHNQLILKSCIPALLDLSVGPTYSSDLRLASVQALVNLSVSGHCKVFFPLAALQSLFQLLGDGSSVLAQHALRVLVNLSADETVVPALLSYKVPDDFLEMLQSHNGDELLVRTLSFLLNLKRASLSSPMVDVLQLNASGFREYLSTCPELTVAVKELLHHRNIDVQQQAGRLMVMLVAP